MSNPAPYYPPNSISQLPRGNLLKYSQDLTQSSVWGLANATVVQAATDPLGGSNASYITLTATGNDYAYQAITGLSPAGKTFTFSIWLVAYTLTGNVSLAIGDGTTNYATATFTPGASWQRVSVSATFPATALSTVYVYIDPVNNTGTAGQQTPVFGAQLEYGPVMGQYVATGASADLGIWGGVQGLPVFPFLPGQNPNVSKAPTWSSEVIKSATGRRRVTSYYPFPLWTFEVSYEVLRKPGASSRPAVDELFTLWEFFNDQAGQFGSFLLVDPTDCQVLTSAPATFGTGDGSTRSFQLMRQINSWTEPVFDVYDPVIYDGQYGPTAYQATTSAAIAPNLLTYSQTFSNAAWVKTNATIGTGITDPLGGTTANSLILTATGNDYVVQTVSSLDTSGITYTFSVWLKAGTMSGNVAIGIEDGSSLNRLQVDCVLTSTWTRFSVTQNFPFGNASTAVQGFIDPDNNSGTAGQTVLMWGAQLEEGGVRQDVTFSPNGVVTFAVAPAAGKPLLWSGYFYFGCCFLQDELTFEQIVNQLWSGKSIKLESLRA